jgi:hypothetical protein
MFNTVDNVESYNEVQILFELLEYKQSSQVEVDNMVVLLVDEKHIHDNRASVDHIHYPFY